MADSELRRTGSSNKSEPSVPVVARRRSISRGAKDSVGEDDLREIDDIVSAEFSVERSRGVASTTNLEVEDEQGDWVAANVPRYALPNTTSLLPEYANAEAEFIHRAFVSSSFDTLNALPDKLDYGQVMRARFLAMESGRKINPNDFKAPTGSKPLDKGFTYVLSPYDLEQQAERERAAAHRKAQAAISSYAFAPPTTVPQRDKHRPGLHDDPAPYMSVHIGDPYDAAQDDALREKWFMESLQLYGPMLPAGARCNLEGPPTKADARDVALTLQKTLCEDWEGVEVAIYSNSQGHWVVRFSLDTVESPVALAAYMNVLLRCNPLVLKLQMARVVEHWNVMPGDGFLYFTLRPPWATARHATETFYVLHPEEKLFSSRREELRAAARKPAEAEAKAAAEMPVQRVTSSAMGQSILGSAA